MVERHFNVEGACNSKDHYMVNLDKRILKIEKLVEQKKYFSIHRGRQYGKTTTLDFLQEKLKKKYSVFYISFEGLTEESYNSESAFCQMFAGLLYDTIDYGEVEGIAEMAEEALESMSKPNSPNAAFRTLSNLISTMCESSEKPVVLMIDEVDQAGNQPIFLAFLGMLRNKYLRRRHRPTFHSVILAGVYDIRNLKMKIRTKDEHQKNSPWNIAAEFDVDMSLDLVGIKGMLTDYENDNHTGMDLDIISDLLYAYTSGYPFLVSRICQLIDEKIAGSPDFLNKSVAWTKEGFLEAIKLLLSEKNTLFESLVNKLDDYPKLREMLYSILFTGDKITFNSDNHVIDIASMFGFVKNNQGFVVVANRIFETRLYNLFLSEEEINSRIFSAGTMDKNQFVNNGILV